jgi:hypothetical protein
MPIRYRPNCHDLPAGSQTWRKGLSAISWQSFFFLVALRYIGGMLWRVRH